MQTQNIFDQPLFNKLCLLSVIATANFASSILPEARLSLPVPGVQPQAPSLGMTVNKVLQLTGAKAGLFLVPLTSISITLLVLAINLLYNSLRDAYDPIITISNG